MTVRLSRPKNSRRLGLSVAGVGFSVHRGERIVRERGIRLNFGL
jgi:ribosomal protein L27